MQSNKHYPTGGVRMSLKVCVFLSQNNELKGTKVQKLKEIAESGNNSMDYKWYYLHIITKNVPFRKYI